MRSGTADGAIDAIATCLAAREDVEKTRNDPVPLHLRNAPTGLMKRLGYGAGYKYPHDDAGPQEYLPPNLRGRVYYKPKSGRAEDGKTGRSPV